MRDLNTVLTTIITAQTQWYYIGLQLELTPDVLDCISTDRTLHRTQDYLRETLRLWLKRVPQPTWESLANALKSSTVEEGRLAKSVEEKYCSPGERHYPRPRRGEKYSEYIRRLYQQLAPVNMLQLPNLPHYEFVTLAMIGKARIKFGGKLDEFSELTIHGKPDDIMREKKEIELEDIFTKDKATVHVVVIDGAPGAGKTMLVWHICHEWAKNKLFTQFRIIVLVTLRDPAVQRAKSIADVLLPPTNEIDAQNVASEMQACRGRGVLFLLDGWDELPEQQRKSKNFLFRELIEKPQNHSLDEVTIIVTSRPVSSGDLLRCLSNEIVSSRIEIVGFISSKIKEYFKTCLESVEEHAGQLDELLRTVEDNPPIESICYLPLNAAIVVYLFCACDHKLPSTYHELFESLVLHCISRDMERKDQIDSQSHQHRQNIYSFDKLPENIREPFKQICKLACFATMEDKIALSSADLPEDCLGVLNNQLGLMQAVPSFLQHGRELTYHFLHLSLQELLAAYHISKMTPATEQVKVFNGMYNKPRFDAVFGFYAGFTKFKTEGIRDVVSRIVKDGKSSDGEKTLLVSLMNWLYEAQDPELCNFVQRELNGVLNLSYTILKPLDALSVGYFLSTVSTTRADLSSCSIEDHHVRLLVKGLSHSEPTANEACVEMNVSKNNIHAEGVKEIADYLQKSNVIKALSLRGNKLSHLTVPLLMKALTDNSSLTRLDISQCSLKFMEEVGESLRTMLEKNESLLSLDISFSEISPDYIADGIQNSSLQTLDMKYCTITAEGVRQISAAIQKGKLEELSIGPLVDDCMEPLSIALTSLKSLTLRGEKVTDQGLENLGNALQGKNSLVKLNLWDFHHVTSEGLKNLVLCLRQNSNLKSLQLSEDQAAEVEETVSSLNKSRQPQAQLKLETQT